MPAVHRGLRLLVADGHPPFVEGIVRVLPECCGAEIVAVCSDGEQALKEIERVVPDVALIDLRMPGIDGRQVLRAARGRRLATRIMLCSASLEPQIVHASLRDGAAGYLAKRPRGTRSARRCSRWPAGRSGSRPRCNPSSTSNSGWQPVGR